MGQWDSGDDWLRRSLRACDDDLMRSIVEDNRNRATSGGSHIPNKVSVVGAGKTVDGDVGPKYRAYQQPTDDNEDRSGWVDPPQLKPPPGIDLIDQMVAAQDEQDLIERAKQMAAAKHARALVEAEVKTKERKKGST
jgi:hypothetical protein